MDRSYRALLRVPTLGRVLISMQIARVAQSMVSVAIVLFTLDRYGSAAFAGLVTFMSVFPGLLISPLAGALLDRHGRIRLVILDFVVALAAMVLIGVLALLDALPGPLLLVIAFVSSLTSILSHVGLRSLFPILVPEHLWERVNAVDSNGYVVATILGPPAAAALVAIFGGPAALVVIGVAFGVAALALIGVPDPAGANGSKGRLLEDAWDGLVYTWRNPTLRGLGFAISLVNLTAGMTTIVIPLIVLERLGQNEAVVGLVFAVSGISGMASALLFGRMDTRGREWALLVWPIVVMAPVVALLLVAAGLVGLGANSGSRSLSSRRSWSACSGGRWTSRSSRFASDGPIGPGWDARSPSRWPSTSWACRSGPRSPASWPTPRSRRRSSCLASAGRWPRRLLRRSSCRARIRPAWLPIHRTLTVAGHSATEPHEAGSCRIDPWGGLRTELSSSGLDPAQGRIEIGTLPPWQTGTTRSSSASAGWGPPRRSTLRAEASACWAWSSTTSSTSSARPMA